MDSTKNQQNSNNASSTVNDSFNCSPLRCGSPIRWSSATRQARWAVSRHEDSAKSSTGHQVVLQNNLNNSSTVVAVNSSFASSCDSGDHLLVASRATSPFDSRISSSIFREPQTQAFRSSKIRRREMGREELQAEEASSSIVTSQNPEISERLTLPHTIAESPELSNPWVPIRASHSQKSDESAEMSNNELSNEDPPPSCTSSSSKEQETNQNISSPRVEESPSRTTPITEEADPSTSRNQDQIQAQQSSQEDRNDMEMLTRPSWCDAGFTLKRVLEGKAAGNVYALQIRAHMHSWLFRLGLFVHKQAVVIAFLAFLILGACSVGLRRASMEVDIEKLWVESGGTLEKELEYSEKITNMNRMNGGVDDGKYTFQILIHTSEEDIQTIDSLKLHAKAAIEAANTKVSMYNQTWSFEELCFKPPFTPTETSNKMINSFISDTMDDVVPCFIISPLDCFWEGSKLLGPSTPITIPSIASSKTWKNLNPLEILDNFPAISGSSRLIEKYKNIFQKAGITDGYQTRYCLDPYDPECPKTAPNYASKENPPVKSLLAEGCKGFATELMEWPKDLIVSSAFKENGDKTPKSRALQTLFHLMSAENVYNFYKDTLKAGNGWSIERAKSLLQAWQRRFIEKIYDSDTTASQLENSTAKDDKLFAFNEATVVDIISEFSTISPYRILGGYFLMLAYAYLTLRKSVASKSQGGVAMAGVVLIAISVAGGLGFSCLIGIKFNAASAQVLPFLLLGLGVDDMFLLACNFAEISLLTYIPIEERTAECLKRVGVSVLLTSIAILSGFLCSLIIPMPALRAFSIQAAIVTAFNMVTVLVSFPALLSMDLQRRHENRVDMFCCLKSSADNAVIDLSYKNMRRSEPIPICYYNGRDDQVVLQATYNNNSYNNYLGAPIVLDQMHAPRTPPPEYTEENHPPNVTSPPRATVAFEDNLPTNENNPVVNSPVGVVTPAGQTPFESVRSSTRSLVPQRGGLCSVIRRRYSDIKRQWTSCVASIPELSVGRLVERYYGPFLLRKEIQVMVLCAAFGSAGYAVYECTHIRDGLDLVDVIPRETRQHSAVEVQQRYFSFYPMFIVTKDFDYANQQDTLLSLHKEISSIKYVIKQTDGTPQQFWYHYFRKWLLNLQEKFDTDWKKGYVDSATWTPQAQDDSVLAWKLLIQTGSVQKSVDKTRIGCLDTTKPCEKIDKVRLVDANGLIPVDAFYNYLTAWFNADPLAIAASQASFTPVPPVWNTERDLNLIIPRAPDLIYTQMPFFLNGLRENEDFVHVIKEVRAVCESKTNPPQFSAYPTGYPFLFWQQYIDLRFWLFISIGCFLTTITLVLSIILMNPRIALLVTFVLAVILTELLAYMGATGVKLSAMPAVILVAALGIGLEFIVHFTLAFITICGDKRYRIIHSLSQTTAPVVDGAVSTLLGVIMLAGAEFDFIVKYFFQVLVVLIVLGILNGLVFLPVLLYRIGPDSEVQPKQENANRLSTPTPPPTLRSGSQNNNNSADYNSPRHLTQRQTTFNTGPYHQTRQERRQAANDFHLRPSGPSGIGEVFDYVRHDPTRGAWVRGQGHEDSQVWRHHPNAMLPSLPGANGMYIYPDLMVYGRRPGNSQMDYIRPPTIRQNIREVWQNEQTYRHHINRSFAPSTFDRPQWFPDFNLRFHQNHPTNTPVLPQTINQFHEGVPVRNGLPPYEYINPFQISSDTQTHQTTNNEPENSIQSADEQPNNQSTSIVSRPARFDISALSDISAMR